MDAHISTLSEPEFSLASNIDFTLDLHPSQASFIQLRDLDLEAEVENIKRKVTFAATVDEKTISRDFSTVTSEFATPELSNENSTHEDADSNTDLFLTPAKATPRPVRTPKSVYATPMTTLALDFRKEETPFADESKNLTPLTRRSKVKQNTMNDLLDRVSEMLKELSDDELDKTRKTEAAVLISHSDTESEKVNDTTPKPIPRTYHQMTKDDSDRTPVGRTPDRSMGLKTFLNQLAKSKSMEVSQSSQQDAGIPDTSTGPTGREQTPRQTRVEDTISAALREIDDLMQDLELSNNDVEEIFSSPTLKHSKPITMKRVDSKVELERIGPEANKDQQSDNVLHFDPQDLFSGESEVIIESEGEAAAGYEEAYLTAADFVEPAFASGLFNTPQRKAGEQAANVHSPWDDFEVLRKDQETLFQNDDNEKIVADEKEFQNPEDLSFFQDALEQHEDTEISLNDDKSVLGSPVTIQNPDITTPDTFVPKKEELVINPLLPSPGTFFASRSGELGSLEGGSFRRPLFMTPKTPTIAANDAAMTPEDMLSPGRTHQVRAPLYQATPMARKAETTATADPQWVDATEFDQQLQKSTHRREPKSNPFAQLDDSFAGSNHVFLPPPFSVMPHNASYNSATGKSNAFGANVSKQTVTIDFPTTKFNATSRTSLTLTNPNSKPSAWKIIHISKPYITVNHSKLPYLTSAGSWSQRMVATGEEPFRFSMTSGRTNPQSSTQLTVSFHAFHVGLYEQTFHLRVAGRVVILEVRGKCTPRYKGVQANSFKQQQQNHPWREFQESHNEFANEEAAHENKDKIHAVVLSQTNGVAEESIDFGSVRLGKSRVHEVRIANGSDKPVFCYCSIVLDHHHQSTTTSVPQGNRTPPRAPSAVQVQTPSSGGTDNYYQLGSFANNPFVLPTKRVRIEPRSFIMFPIVFQPQVRTRFYANLMIRKNVERVKIRVTGMGVCA